MIGLKRGTVTLVPYQEKWSEDAEKIISLLKHLLGDTAIDIQHVGSTAVYLIHGSYRFSGGRSDERSHHSRGEKCEERLWISCGGRFIKERAVVQMRTGKEIINYSLSI